ncbi:MAG: methyltransferase [Bacteroidetes bacterium GWF2_42_66]|nr:MAG: methyltransferase [Bacteroidetes bacterium GWA2_42_15]OFX96636.1 MAG: methyltransferase [Bacteroidetes bacterium GWE2_42_39]OFY45357.1 MAG: methyltransferase [Bacteroidetes bacterium GWF2_42_66]HAZ02358.1 methyltransferase [Marinilabiliales bacterium]HBL76428.1 methyltransferase [Prolixibacteraceae bacterium]
MTSKERVIKSLNHETPDRIPVDFGSTSVTGVHALAVENLRACYGLEKKPVRVTDPYQMLGEIDEELADIMGVDVTGAKGRKNSFGFYNHEPFMEYETPWGQIVLVPEGFRTTTDKNGDILMYPEGDISAQPSGRMPRTGYFFDAIIRQQPIDEEKLDYRDNLEEYGLISDSDLEYWKVTTQKARATGKAVIAGFGGTALGDIAHIPGIKLKNPKGIRDITEWYMSILMRPDYIRAIFERQSEIALENFSRIHKVVGDNVDAVYICGTDFGTQDSTFCSPEQFDDLWLPYYRRINDWVHSNTNWKTFKHSCGAVEPFLSRFIAAGFDIINPVQVNAKGMDPAHLKKTYGKDLVFWGGGIDTQKTLPYSTPEKVREEVLRLCKIFAKDGGFVFNTVHNIQANVPVKNIVAMVNAIKEFNGVR